MSMINKAFKNILNFILFIGLTFSTPGLISFQSKSGKEDKKNDGWQILEQFPSKKQVDQPAQIENRSSHHQDPGQKQKIKGLKKEYWNLEDSLFKGPKIDIFDQFNPDHSEKILTKAAEAFEFARKFAQGYLNRKKDLEKKWKNEKPNDIYQWQVTDRAERRRKILGRLKIKNSHGMITRLVKIINILDEAENLKVTKSENFIRLKASVFREYIKNQYLLKNYGQAIPVLEKYLLLLPEHQLEVKVHEYLTECYRFQERSASKSHRSTKIVQFYQSKKHNHMLQLTSLKYGASSREYFKVLEKVEIERAGEIN